MKGLMLYGCALALAMAPAVARAEASLACDSLPTVCVPMSGPSLGCQPLLDDPARITFRTRPNLDMVRVTGRSVPLTTMDPANELVIFTLSNSYGIIFSEAIVATRFIPNAKLTAWKFVLKRTGLPLLYNFRINKKLNRTTGATEFILKVKAEGYLDLANPDSLAGHTVDQLKTMTIQITVGDDVFYNTADWVVKGNGWYLADKYMFL